MNKETIKEVIEVLYTIIIGHKTLKLKEYFYKYDLFRLDDNKLLFFIQTLLYFLNNERSVNITHEELNILLFKKLKDIISDNYSEQFFQVNENKLIYYRKLLNGWNK